MFNRKQKTVMSNTDHYEALSSHAVAFANAVIMKENRYKINCDSQSLLIELNPYFDHPVDKNLTALTVLANGFRCKIIISVSELIPWLPPPCNDAMDDAPLEMIKVALELSLAKTPETLQRFDITNLKVLTFDPYIPNDRHNIMYLHVTINNGLNSLSLLIEKNDFLFQKVKQLPEPSLFQNSILPLNVYFSIGRACLTLREISSLDEGDVILMMEYYWQNHEAQVFIEDKLFGVAVEQNGSVALINQELWMGSQTDESLAGALSKLELDVRFDLGKVKLPLAELLNLKDGYVFDLKRDDFAPISMMVNGIKVADCQLVSVSGKIGAKIIQSDSSMLNAEIAELKQTMSRDTTAHAEPPVLEEFLDD